MYQTKAATSSDNGNAIAAAAAKILIMKNSQNTHAHTKIIIVDIKNLLALHTPFVTSNVKTIVDK